MARRHRLFQVLAPSVVNFDQLFALMSSMVSAQARVAVANQAWRLAEAMHAIVVAALAEPAIVLRWHTTSPNCHQPSTLRGYFKRIPMRGEPVG